MVCLRVTCCACCGLACAVVCAHVFRSTWRTCFACFCVFLFCFCPVLSWSSHPSLFSHLPFTRFAAVPCVIACFFVGWSAAAELLVFCYVRAFANCWFSCLVWCLGFSSSCSDHLFSKKTFVAFFFLSPFSSCSFSSSFFFFFSVFSVFFFFFLFFFYFVSPRFPFSLFPLRLCPLRLRPAVPESSRILKNLLPAQKFDTVD